MRTGNKYLRYYLVQVADSVRKHDAEYGEFYQKKYDEVPKHKNKRALVLSARKLVRLVFMGDTGRKNDTGVVRAIPLSGFKCIRHPLIVCLIALHALLLTAGVGHFYKSQLYPVLRHMNDALVVWARRKYKKLAKHKTRAIRWLGRLAKNLPHLFAHWQMGIVPATG
ncbi:hypothetical protein SD70_14800 [Gordoniibacillus kamchatkensis]|uniref:Transposase n=1 Tax=Gordoniibacillus kamchatkensis TaxID=1590651 RepID=A0ABR5AGV6_9BACL|nr:hypothetical protein SD70_14800 [Paenibacillus sp. VKM B-2647]